MKRSAEAEPALDAFVPPEEAGSLAYAQMWYYQDNQNVDQGPNSPHDMRAWFLAGFLPGATPVAPSYYGEVCAWYHMVYVDNRVAGG